MIICFDNNLYQPKLVSYTKKPGDSDEYVAKKFVNSLEEDVKEIYKKYKFKKRLIFKEEDEKGFENAKECYACGRKS